MAKALLLVNPTELEIFYLDYSSRNSMVSVFWKIVGCFVREAFDSVEPLPKLWILFSRYSQDSPATATKETGDEKVTNEEFVNSQGVTFTPTADMVDDSGSLIPYGLPCVRELFRFLVSLINPHDGIGSSPGTGVYFIFYSFRTL